MRGQTARAYPILDTLTYQSVFVLDELSASRVGWVENNTLMEYRLHPSSTSENVLPGHPNSTSTVGTSNNIIEPVILDMDVMSGYYVLAKTSALKGRRKRIASHQNGIFY